MFANSSLLINIFNLNLCHRLDYDFEYFFLVRRLLYDALYVVASEVLLENLACVDGEHGERRHVDLSARIAFKLVISNVANGLYLLNGLHAVLDRHTEVGEDDYQILFLVLRA